MKIIGVFTITILLILLMQIINNLPIVYWSYTKNECVKVYKEGKECPCSAVDLKNDMYEKVMVR